MLKLEKLSLQRANLISSVLQQLQIAFTSDNVGKHLVELATFGAASQPASQPANSYFTLSFSVVFAAGCAAAAFWKNEVDKLFFLSNTFFLGGGAQLRVANKSVCRVRF